MVVFIWDIHLMKENEKTQWMIFDKKEPRQNVKYLRTKVPFCIASLKLKEKTLANIDIKVNNFQLNDRALSR